MPRDFTIDDVDRLARLARLDLTSEEKTLFAHQLSAVLAYAERVQEVDTTGVPPLSHPTGAGGTLRDDQRCPSLPAAEALAQAPDVGPDARLFKVPRVLGS